MFSGLMRVRIWQKQHETTLPNIHSSGCLWSNVVVGWGLNANSATRQSTSDKEKCAANKSVVSV